MRAEIRAKQRAAERKRNVVIAAVCGIVLLTGSVIAFWPDGSRWRDQPLVSGLIPATPGTEWSEGDSPSSWLRLNGLGQDGSGPGTTTSSTAPTSTRPAGTSGLGSPVQVPGATGVPSSPAQTSATAVPTKPNGSPMPSQANKKPRPTPPPTTVP